MTSIAKKVSGLRDALAAFDEKRAMKGADFACADVLDVYWRHVEDAYFDLLVRARHVIAQRAYIERLDRGEDPKESHDPAQLDFLRQGDSE